MLVRILQLSFFVSTIDAQPPAPTLKSDAVDTEAGYLTLSWSHPAKPPIEYQLVERVKPGALAPPPKPSGAPPEASSEQIRYQGSTPVYFVSGLADGDYEFRVRARVSDAAPWSPWSDAVVVRVEHHALADALWLAGIGGAVFILTAGYIIVRSRRVGRGDDA